jgi:hypothetical protein
MNGSKRSNVFSRPWCPIQPSLATPFGSQLRGMLLLHCFGLVQRFNLPLQCFRSVIWCRCFRCRRRIGFNVNLHLRRISISRSDRGIKALPE